MLADAAENLCFAGTLLVLIVRVDDTCTKVQQARVSTIAKSHV